MIRIVLVDDNKEFLEIMYNLITEGFSKRERLCEIESFSVSSWLKRCGRYESA